jgi:hypothetical protein
MAVADGGAGSGAWPERQWDVALSFAGAQRDYVERVAKALKARGVRCFYDADEQVELWGKYLADELPAIYGEQAAAVVIFMSAEYAAREWTRLERRTALARAVRERQEYVLPARFDDTALPGLPSDMVTVDLRIRKPRQFAAMIVGKLAALAAASAASADAEGPAQSARSARPAGAMRVSEADPRRLGVHAAISVPGVPDEALPEYVPRDVDAAEFGVRARVAAAAERGGFVLLVGGSSVGKTRCAVEAAKALLPDWWLVHPAGAAEVAALAAASSPRTVIWLDELHRYLDGEHGLTGGVVRDLLNAPHPAVIIGTMWPDWYTAYSALPAFGGADPHERKREVLDLAHVIRIGPEFSSAEQDRARAAAARDPRLRIALDTVGYGLTQTLAAVPQLVARWEDAQTARPYGWAVLTAALDAARLGARAPLNADLLRAAAPGYCTSQQRAEAPEDWFEQALAYATGKLYAAAAALSPVGGDMGQVAGYTTSDYLLQLATWRRRSARIPASTWDALLSHVRDPADAARLAESANGRLLYCYAVPLYRKAADGANLDAAEWLAERGDLAALRALADADDKGAAYLLDELLARHGDLDKLRDRADAGNAHAAWRLAELLYERRDLGELRDRADAGDGHAADLLARHRNLDELRDYTDAGDRKAARQLADLLAKRGDLDTLRAMADAGNKTATLQLAELLAAQGDLDRAVQTLRPLADAGDRNAANQLAELLARRGDVDELRARADAGDRKAAMQLGILLAGRDDLDRAIWVLRARADAGDRNAARRLASLLYELEDLGELRDRADAGDEYAADRLDALLAARGDLNKLRARADAGDRSAGRRLTERLAELDDLDGLRARAEASDEYATDLVAHRLAARGDLDGAIQILQVRADPGDRNAISRLVSLLAASGDLDEAIQVLYARANVGAGDAARLAELLTQQGRGEEAKRLLRFGLNPDGSVACG